MLYKIVYVLLFHNLYKFFLGGFIMGLKTAFLFDVDGVIVDTPHEESWRAAALDLNLFSEDFNFRSFYQEKIAGIPGLGGAQKILENFSYYKSKGIIDPIQMFEKAKEFREHKQELFKNYIDRGEFNVFEDIISIIKGARDNNIPIAAVSSSENAERILKRIKLFSVFDSTTLGAITHRAQKKEHLYSFAFGKLCQKLGSQNLPYPVIFEDADGGITAAKNLRYFCVGIAREGLTTESSLINMGADLAYNGENLLSKGYVGIMSDVEKSLARLL